MVKKPEAAFFDMDVVIEALTQQIGKDAEGIVEDPAFKKHLRSLRRQRKPSEKPVTAAERKAEYELDKKVLLLANLFSIQETVTLPSPEIVVRSVLIPERKVAEGVLVRSTSVVWQAIVERLQQDWSQAFDIPPRVWEEIVAGAYKKAGFDEVVLTPGSEDDGRDVIAVKKGVGSVRILGSVKAYRPGHLATKEEVHALLGVVNIDPNASKGIFTTTSDFAPRLLKDARVAAAVPHRLELMNGHRLQAWLKEVSKKR